MSNLFLAHCNRDCAVKIASSGFVCRLARVASRFRITPTPSEGPFPCAVGIKMPISYNTKVFLVMDKIAFDIYFYSAAWHHRLHIRFW